MTFKFPFELNIQFDNQYLQFAEIRYVCSRIEKEGLTESVIMLCKLNKSMLESSISVGIHRQKSLYYLMNLCI